MTEEQMEEVFDLLTDLIENEKPYNESLKKLKSLLTGYGILEEDKEGIVIHAIAKLEKMLQNFKENDKDILIYTSYIGGFIEEVNYMENFENEGTQEEKQ